MDAGAGGVDHGGVVGVEGLRDEDLVAIVQDALEDDGQSLGTTGGDEDLVLLEVHVQVVIVLLDGIDQFGHTRRGSVLQDRLAEVAHSLEKLRGGLHIGLTDIQVIDLAALGFGCHCVGMELTHGGQTALFDFARKLHVLTSKYLIFAPHPIEGSKSSSPIVRPYRKNVNLNPHRFPGHKTLESRFKT